MNRPNLRFLPSVFAASILSSGCFAVGLATLFTTQPIPAGVQGQAPPAIVQLDGLVGIGIGDLADTFTLLSSAATLNNSSPLANVTSLANVTPLTQVSPLDATSISSLIGNSGSALIGNSGSALIGNSGSALIGNSGSALSLPGFRVQADDEFILVVEVVDPSTGVLSDLLDSAGKRAGVRLVLGSKFKGDFSSLLRLPGASGKRALMVQATGLKGGKVTSFMAAPLRLDAVISGTSTIKTTVSPASTTVALSYTLLSGITTQFDVSKGFRGFKTGQIGSLVAFGGTSASAKGTAALDKAKSFTGAVSFEELLASAASASVVLAQKTADRAKDAGGDLNSQIAAGNLVLEKLSGLAPTTDISLGISNAGDLVQTSEVVAAKAKIAADALVSAKDYLGSLLKFPTPAPKSGSGGSTSTGGNTGVSTGGNTGVSTGGNTGVSTGGNTGVSTGSNTGSTTTPAVTPAPRPGPVHFSESAANWHVVTIAGDGSPGFANGTNSKLNAPSQLLVDGVSDVYFTDDKNQVVRRVKQPSNSVDTVAGTPGVVGSIDGQPSAATFNRPGGIAIINQGPIILVADALSNKIRLLNFQNGAISLVSTHAGTGASSPVKNGPKALATFSNPGPLFIDHAGDLIIADRGFNCIRKINSQGDLVVFAGQCGPTPGYLDGPSQNARFDSPSGITGGPEGMFVADTGNNCIRLIKANGFTDVVAGSPGNRGDADGTLDARFNKPTGLFYSNGFLFICDTGNSKIRLMDTRTFAVRTFSGGGPGFRDGEGTAALFDSPTGIFVTTTDGAIYVADTGGNRIRKFIHN